jgi:hypothetical protein
MEKRCHVIKRLEGQRDLEIWMTDKIYAMRVSIESRWRLRIVLWHDMDVESVLGELLGFPDLALNGIFA